MTDRWEYLKPRRERIIYRYIQPYLKSVDTALDWECGHSPLAPYLIANGISITGFDHNAEAIQELHTILPTGTWKEQDSRTFESHKSFDLVMWLGLDNPSTELFLATVDRAAPQIVVIEYAPAFQRAKAIEKRLAKILSRKYTSTPHKVFICESLTPYDLRHLVVWGRIE